MSYFARGRTGLFSSVHLGAHLLRGAISVGLIYWAVTHQEARPVGAALAGLAAMVAMRGCPVCWLTGLVETLANRRRKPASLSRRMEASMTED